MLRKTRATVFVMPKNITITCDGSGDVYFFVDQHNDPAGFVIRDDGTFYNLPFIVRAPGEGDFVAGRRDARDRADFTPFSVHVTSP